MRSGAGKICLRIAAVLLILHVAPFALAKSHRHPKTVPHPASLIFIQKDGTCVEGTIARIEPKAIVVQTTQAPAVKIKRSDLLQASQDDSLFFSARSSWADTQAVRLWPNESLLVRTRKGLVIKGSPLFITPDSLIYKRFLWLKKKVAKDQIVTVDYLREKPVSDAIDYFAQEGPAMLFFYPDFYDRLKGLEGRIPVRLYDALLPENNAPLKCPGH